MDKINETSSISAFQNRDDLRGIPFYGQKGDFNFVTGRSQFTPGISIKLLPLRDLSRKGDAGISEFDQMLGIIRQHFNVGDRVRGKEVNSYLDSEEGTVSIGRIEKIEIDRKNNSIKVLIKDPETLETSEIYFDSMEKIIESKYYAKSFDQFIGS